MTYPQSEFSVPPHVSENYMIVRIGGQLVWVTKEKWDEYNKRYTDLGGEWSWDQELNLDRLEARRRQATKRALDEVNERVEQKRREFAIQENIAARMVMRAAGWDANEDGSFNPPRPGGVIKPPRPDGVIKINSPSTELIDKKKRARLRWMMTCLCFLGISNAFTMPESPQWLQWMMVIIYVPAVAMILHQLRSSNKKIAAQQISSVTFTPLPSSVTGYVRDKPRSEQYADKFVETGHLMYKYLMEDAYAREHAHDFDIQELP